MATMNTADIGFEREIWKAADKMRGNIDASEYKSVVLGLIFLKYISDKFDEYSSAFNTSKSKKSLGAPASQELFTYKRHMFFHCMRIYSEYLISTYGLSLEMD